MMRRLLNYYIKAGEAKQEELLKRWAEKPTLYRWEDIVAENIKQNRLNHTDKFIV